MVVEPEFVVRSIKTVGKLTATWPSDPRLKSFKKIIHELIWILSFLNVIGLLVPLVLGVYYYQNQPTIMMKALSELTALGDVFCNLIICKLKEKQLYVLLSEFLEYESSVKSNEKKILRENINKYFLFWTVIGISYIQTAIAFSWGPFFMNQILPADTWYPFSIEPFTTRYYIIYIQQVIAILQTGLCITVDFMVAILLCYSSTKLQMLNLRLESVQTLKDLNECIVEHQKCIRFYDELANSAKYIILKSNITMAMAVIFGAFPILNHEPLPVTSQFILMVIGGCLRLYISAWPADNVREMSEKICLSTYNSLWIYGPLKMQKSIIIIFFRAQKPLTISIKGVLPALTLKFYASFLSSTLSYFMTLRAVMEK